MFQFESPETGLTASFPVAAGIGMGFTALHSCLLGVQAFGHAGVHGKGFS
jgi:hypothetical protein